MCIDLWRASCVGDAMCYAITTCIRLSSTSLVRPEDCDEGVGNIHASLVDRLLWRTPVAITLATVGAPVIAGRW